MINNYIKQLLTEVKKINPDNISQMYTYLFDMADYLMKDYPDVSNWNLVQDIYEVLIMATVLVKKSFEPGSLLMPKKFHETLKEVHHPERLPELLELLETKYRYVKNIEEKGFLKESIQNSYIKSFLTEVKKIRPIIVTKVYSPKWFVNPSFNFRLGNQIYIGDIIADNNTVRVTFPSQFSSKEFIMELDNMGIPYEIKSNGREIIINMNLFTFPEENQ